MSRSSARAGAGPRRGRYAQVNAYGPRWADLYASLLEGTAITRHGHLLLNDAGGLRHDPEGPVVWLPAQEAASAATTAAFALDILRLAAQTPVLVQVPAPAGRAAKALRVRLARTPGITLVPPESNPYSLLEGARALFTGPSGLGLEAFCCGIPVAMARLGSTRPTGLQLELADRVPVFEPGAGLAEWAQAPPLPGDDAWASDLLFDPRRQRNDSFAAELRKKAVEMAL